VEYCQHLLAIDAVTMLLITTFGSSLARQGLAPLLGLDELNWS
jgi:hypothetical protein